MHPHHDSELISWYHDAFLPWDHYLNNIVLFFHDSPITRSHFMDPTDRAIRGFYCICNKLRTNSLFPKYTIHRRSWSTLVCWLTMLSMPFPTYKITVPMLTSHCLPSSMHLWGNWIVILISIILLTFICKFLVQIRTLFPRHRHHWVNSPSSWHHYIDGGGCLIADSGSRLLSSMPTHVHTSIH